jgi:hypothetical protein
VRLLVVIALATLLAIAGETYRSASVDDAGRLHIVPDSGKEVVLRKLEGQCSFGDAWISDDRLSVGWLVMCRYPFPNSDEFGVTLAVFRGGRIVREFTGGVFWDWQFQDGGRRIAYASGATHGDVTYCALVEVDSGKVVADWSPKNGGDPPAWAASLRY